MIILKDKMYVIHNLKRKRKHMMYKNLNPGEKNAKAFEDVTTHFSHQCE